MFLELHIRTLGSHISHLHQLLVIGNGLMVVVPAFYRVDNEDDFREDKTVIILEGKGETRLVV